MKAVLRKFLQRRSTIVAGVVIVAGGAVAGVVYYSHHAPQVTTYKVSRGEFVDTIQLRGRFKALKKVEINAPGNVGQLHILKIVGDGSRVKPGEMVVEFDRSGEVQTLARDRSALRSAQANIDEARAKALLTEEKDKTAVMKAQYDVEAARLDASKREILSQIDGAEALLKLNTAKQALDQAKAQLKADQMKDRAAISGEVEASRKAQYEVTRTAHTLTQMKLVAPIGGTISLVPVWHFNGQRPFAAGDQAWSGAPIAEIPDAATLRISARVNETERGRLAVGQKVIAKVEAVNDRQFTGKITRISTIATEDFSAGWPIQRNFDLQISLDHVDARLKPGMRAQLTVIVDRVPHAISIPAEASFLRSGRTVVYLWTGSKFQPHPIQILRRSRNRILIASGLHPGDVIALADPTRKE